MHPGEHGPLPDGAPRDGPQPVPDGLPEPVLPAPRRGQRGLPRGRGRDHVPFGRHARPPQVPGAPARRLRRQQRYEMLLNGVLTCILS